MYSSASVPCSDFESSVDEYYVIVVGSTLVARSAFTMSP